MSCPHELFSLLQIKRLDLSFNQLATLPGELVTLVNLRHLILTGNKFAVMPDVLCDMDKLQTLVLSKNAIREVPMAITRMAELRELDLFMNKIAQLAFLEPTRELRTLSVRANKLSELSDTLVQLRSLTHLDVSNNKIPSLVPLAHMPRLARLECAGCSLRSLAVLGQPNLPLCASLTVLVVSRNPELTTLCDLSCPLLSELRAVGCSIDRVPTSFQNCPRLRVLDLDSNPVSELLSLATPKLENLGVCNTKLHLFPKLEFGALVELALANSQVARMPEKATPPLKTLRRLYLQENDIWEIQHDFLLELSLLQDLSLRGNKLMRVPREMVVGPALVMLDLASNCLVDLPGGLFDTASSLMQLNLAENHLSDLPPSLWTCSNLMFLNVFCNKLESVSPQIGNLAKLRELFLGNNKLKTLPPEMSLLCQLKLLHIAGNTIRTISPTLQLDALEKFYASRNHMDGFPDCLSRCSRLDTLDLSGNVIVTAVVASCFPNLQELILSHNGMHVFQTPRGAGDTFPKLVCLDLSNNEINAVPEIEGIRTLEIVNLLHCNISHLTRKQLDEYAHLSLLYMQGNPVEKTRQLRVSFVEHKTDLLMADLHKTPHNVALGYRLRNSSTDADLSSMATADENVGPGVDLLFSWSEIKGARTTQEDAISVRSEMQGEEQMQLFAVFDGHRGSDVSKLCAVHFPTLLRTQLANPAHTTITAIKATFEGLAKIIVTRELSDGATAAVALIQQENIAIAHLGDARAVLFSQASAPGPRGHHSDEDESATSSSTITASPTNFRHMTRKVVRVPDGGSVQITATMDHTAKNRVERRRVEQELGGFVSEAGHVMGDCAVTRALGDLQFSPFVTNEPSIMLLPRTGKEMFIVVACDGFWDVCSNEKALHIALDHLKAGGDSSKCSLHLRDYALSMGSQDNISVLCVLFPAFLTAV